MSAETLRRLDELISLGARGVPPAQRQEWLDAFTQGLDAAKAAGAAPREVYLRAVQAPTFTTRQRITANAPSAEQAEAAARYYESLGIENAGVRAAVIKGIHMPRALAERLRALAEKEAR